MYGCRVLSDTFPVCVVDDHKVFSIIFFFNVLLEECFLFANILIKILELVLKDEIWSLSFSG